MLVETNCGAAQQILHRDFPDVAAGIAILDHLGHARNGLVSQAGSVAAFQNPSHLRTGSGRHGDQDQLDILRARGSFQSFAIAQNSHALYPHAGLLRVVVQEAADLVGQG